MSEVIITTIVTAFCASLPSLIAALNTRKLIDYRLELLTKQVEKHNGVIERVFKLEYDNKTNIEKIDELEKALKELEK